MINKNQTSKKYHLIALTNGSEGLNLWSLLVAFKLIPLITDTFFTKSAIIYLSTMCKRGYIYLKLTCSIA